MSKHVKRGLVVVIAACAVGFCGCYERTVSAKGLGAKGTTVQEGYRSDTALDRAWDSLFANPKEAKPVPRNQGVVK